jgi:hypothetical protein
MWLARNEPLGLLGLMVPMVPFGMGWWGLRHAVRIHEHGIEVDTLFESARMRYDEADRLVYRAVAESVNGIPAGRYVRAQLRGGGGKATFHLRAGEDNVDALEEFRSRASAAIVARASKRLVAGEPFAWGSAATLHPDALRYRPSRLLGRKPEQAVAYAGLRYAFSAGNFFVYPPDADRALFGMGCDEPNFFPGFALFELLAAPR